VYCPSDDTRFPCQRLCHGALGMCQHSCASFQAPAGPASAKVTHVQRIETVEAKDWAGVTLDQQHVHVEPFDVFGSGYYLVCKTLGQQRRGRACWRRCKMVCSTEATCSCAEHIPACKNRSFNAMVRGAINPQSRGTEEHRNWQGTLQRSVRVLLEAVATYLNILPAVQVRRCMALVNHIH
jgi:hypothetical protein